MKKGQDDKLPLRSFSLWQKNQGRYCPDAKEETQYGPEVFGIPVVIGEKAAHNPVEKVNDKNSPKEGREGKVIRQKT